MKYKVGTVGRIILVRLEDGESLYAEVERIAEEENLSQAAVWLIGGIKNGRIIVGPKGADRISSEVLIEQFSDPREILGLGTLFRNAAGKPKLHLHAAIGKGRASLVGCPREGADCWLVTEVVIMEISGVDARRLKDKETGFELLTLDPEVQ